MALLIGLCVSGVLALLTFLWFSYQRRTAGLPDVSDPLGKLAIYVDSLDSRGKPLADLLSAQARSYKFTPHVTSLEHFSVTEFKRHDYAVIICASEEGGHSPSTALPFLKWVTKVAKASDQDLSKLAYGGFGLCVDRADRPHSTSKSLRSSQN